MKETYLRITGDISEGDLSQLPEVLILLLKIFALFNTVYKVYRGL